MLKAHHATYHSGFAGISEIFDKLKSAIQYVQWKRLEREIDSLPQELQSKIMPYIQLQIKKLDK